MTRIAPFSDAAQKYRKRYHLEPWEYRELVAQGCAICGTTVDVVVDHDHRTNKVRGPLCDEHNRSLGGFDDSVIMLLKAAWYLLTR